MKRNSRSAVQAHAVFQVLVVASATQSSHMCRGAICLVNYITEKYMQTSKVP